METKDSRFLGGIHYKYCCDRSNLMGKELGDLIVAKVNMKK